MKANINSKITVLAETTMAALQESVRADVSWNGSMSSDWGTAANSTGGLPSAGGAGKCIINPESPNVTPMVSMAGNFKQRFYRVQLGS